MTKVVVMRAGTGAKQYLIASQVGTGTDSGPLTNRYSAWLAAVVQAWASMDRGPAFAGITKLTDTGHYMASGKELTAG